MAPFTKIRRELEPRWVVDCVENFYPSYISKFRVPLGPIPENLIAEYGEAKAINVYRPSRPEADAMVIFPSTLMLLEAKVVRYMDGLAKLPVYKSLIPTTPELREYKDWPVVMRLLIPVPIPWVEIACANIGVEYHAWAPDYIKQAWDEKDKYWTKEKMFARELRKKKLREEGFE